HGFAYSAICCAGVSPAGDSASEAVDRERQASRRNGNPRASSPWIKIADRGLAPRSWSRFRRKPRSGGRHVISTSLIVAAFLGFLLVVLLIIGSGAAEVASTMLVLGWWLVPITLFHLAPLTFDALAWRELFPTAGRPAVPTFIW